MVSFLAFVGGDHDGDAGGYINAVLADSGSAAIEAA